jgi:hypothetical protein
MCGDDDGGAVGGGRRRSAAVEISIRTVLLLLYTVYCINSTVQRNVEWDIILDPAAHLDLRPLTSQRFCFFNTNFSRRSDRRYCIEV